MIEFRERFVVAIGGVVCLGFWREIDWFLREMVAGAVLDVQYQCNPLDAADFHKVDDMADLSSPLILGSHSVTTFFSFLSFFLGGYCC